MTQEPYVCFSAFLRYIHLYTPRSLLALNCLPKAASFPIDIGLTIRIVWK